MNQDSKQYFRDMKAMIPSRGKQERRLVRDYKTRILELNEKYPDITYEALQQALGTPADMIASFYESADTEYIIKSVRTAHMIRFCICCMLIFTLSALAVSAGVNVRLYQEIHHGIVTHEKIIIE